jgi:hypothetical protein
MQFILGPIFVILGILMMRYTVQITNFTGDIDFAEEHLTSGIGAGTYTFWRLIGLGLAIIGGMWFFGLLDVIGGMLRSIFAVG